MRIESPPPDGDPAGATCTPAFIDWRWHYNVPMLSLWALIVLLLVALKRNRNKQAWWILLPLGLLAGIWHLPAWSLFLATSNIENISYVTEWCALAWSVVYLTAPWLATRFRFRTFCLTLAVMLIVGLASAYCLFLELTTDAVPFGIIYGISVFVLLLAMMLTSLKCRKKFMSRRFSLWLLVMIWTVLASVSFLWAMLILFTLPTNIVPYLIAVVPVAAIFGVVLYVLNLPFLLLAFHCPFYRDRFESLFRVEKDFCTKKLTEEANHD